MARMNGDIVVFDSGKQRDADGVVGLSGDLKLYQGYDTKADVTLTPDQRRELADLMIAQWQAFKDATEN